MAIVFPTSPTLNEEFTADNKTWIWDGEKWVFAPSNPENISAEVPVTYNPTTQVIGIEEDRLISFVNPRIKFSVILLYPIIST